MPLCVNIASLAEVLKCAKDNVIVTIEAGDYAVLRLAYEAKDPCRIAEDMKLIDMDSDTLGMRDTDYDVSITMHVSEFSCCFSRLML